ncbi:hypothetical protein H5410_031429 [Solanum commersonii]|uniref:Uncharacterized protein n=1 Tax=Solanum commersonii TaxID=4109 RepID=A0A9J5YH45_SOLCO|nr:hypothetical protein H5410_031429 [Solanum commersonii]
MRTHSGGQTRAFKRPRMVGVGIYQAEDGFTTLNLGLLSKRVINTGTRVTKRADVVTGDIGYTPVIQTRSAATATANSQSQTRSSRKTHVPWK